MKKLAMIVALVLITGTVWGFLRTKPDDTKIEKLVLTDSKYVSAVCCGNRQTL